MGTQETQTKTEKQKPYSDEVGKKQAETSEAAAQGGGTTEETKGGWSQENIDYLMDQGVRGSKAQQNAGQTTSNRGDEDANDLREVEMRNTENRH